MSVQPMSEAEERFTEPRGQAALWYGLLIGAVAWKLQLVVNYTVVPYACWNRVEFLNHAASFAMLALALSGCWVAWGSWKKAGESRDMEMGGVLGRSRFMAAAGLGLNALFALMILGQWLPNLMLSPCDGIS
jgi:Co/Zn/Cd efflux system component